MIPSGLHINPFVGAFSTLCMFTHYVAFSTLTMVKTDNKKGNITTVSAGRYSCG